MATIATNKWTDGTGADYIRWIEVVYSVTQSVENNTSTITYNVYGRSEGSSTSKWVEASKVKAYMNGVCICEKTDVFKLYKDQKLSSGTLTVKHTAEGSKTISASISGAIYESKTNVSYSGSIKLPTIARATTPTISPTTVEMGKSITISLPRASSSFTHNVTYKFGSATGTIASAATTSCTFTPGIALANQIPNATSGTGTITVQTKNGSTVIGTKSVSFKATVPASVKPTISNIADSDPTGNKTTYGEYIQTKSKLKIDVTAAGAYSSKIAAYKIEANGIIYTANGSTTEELKTAGSNTVKVTVTDSRGRTATSTVTISVLAYTKPKVSSLKVVRCNADGTDNEEGEYFKATFEAAITPISDQNNKSFELEYREQEGTWATEATYTDAYSISDTRIVAISTNSMYEVRLTATDSFSETALSVMLGTAYTLMDFHSSGKGIALGKVSEGEGLDCNLETRFRQDIRSEGDVIANMGETNQIALSSLIPRTSVVNSGFSNSFTGNITAHDIGNHRDLQIYLIAGKSLTSGTWYEVYTFTKKPLSTCRAIVVANTNTFIPVVVELQSTGLMRIYPRAAMAINNDIRLTLSFAT